MSLWHREGGFGVLLPRRRWLVAAVALCPVLIGFGGATFFIICLPMGFFFLGQHIHDKRHNVTGMPFSFCLPGYRQSLRLGHFAEGALTGLALAFWLLRHAWTRWWIRDSYADLAPQLARPDAPEPVVVVLAMASAILAGTTGFSAMCVLGYSPRRWIRCSGCVAGTICAVIVLLVDLPEILWCALVPFWLALGMFSWTRLGDIGYVTQGHRRMIDGERSMPVPSAVTKWNSPGVERFLRRFMKRYDYLSTAKYCWGQVYQSFTPGLSYWRIELVLCAACALLLGFLGEAIAGVWFIVAGFAVVNQDLPLAPTQILLLPAGRRERCLATGAAAIGASLLVQSLGVVAIIASWFLWLVIRALPWEGMRSAFSGINPTWFYWPCLLVPWVTAARLLRGWAATMVQGGLVVATLLLMGGLYLLYIHAVGAWKVHAAYLGVFVSGWLLLLVVLHVSFRTCDLGAPDT
ncbi:MAG: hypothetical protein ABFD90_00235 [Phycisphaerales bacterium]